MAPTNAAMGTTQVVQVSKSGWKTVMSDETVMTANAATHTQATCSVHWRKPTDSHTTGGKDCRVNGLPIKMLTSAMAKSAKLATGCTQVASFANRPTITSSAKKPSVA